jgi:hypothetical protein
MDPKYDDTPQLGFWEKADLPFARLAIVATALYAALTGVFRGKSYPAKFKHHIIATTVRKSTTRMSDLQMQCVLSPPKNQTPGRQRQRY